MFWIKLGGLWVSDFISLSLLQFSLPCCTLLFSSFGAGLAEQDVVENFTTSSSLGLIPSRNGTSPSTFESSSHSCRQEAIYNNIIMSSPVLMLTIDFFRIHSIDPNGRYCKAPSIRIGRSRWRRVFTQNLVTRRCYPVGCLFVFLVLCFFCFPGGVSVLMASGSDTKRGHQEGLFMP